MGTDLNVLAAQIAKNSEENRRLQQLLMEKTTMMQHAGLLPTSRQGQNNTSGGVKVLHAAQSLDKRKNVMPPPSIPPPGKTVGNPTSSASLLTNCTGPISAGTSSGIGGNATGAPANLRPTAQMEKLQFGAEPGTQGEQRRRAIEQMKPTRARREQAWVNATSSMEPRQPAPPTGPSLRGSAQPIPQYIQEPRQTKGARRKQVETHVGDSSNRFTALALMEEDDPEEEPTPATIPPPSNTDSKGNRISNDTSPLTRSSGPQVDIAGGSGHDQVDEDHMDFMKEVKRKPE
ncbi:hypothetical protein R1sor_019583 [Riccia sorocarpa]|uniref:Uncharacterized protein n=1 Tax=Riccia sorocarpa TaxID=122646 RepID=A0ABD3IH37_9MARC